MLHLSAVEKVTYFPFAGWILFVLSKQTVVQDCQYRFWFCLLLGSDCSVWRFCVRDGRYNNWTVGLVLAVWSRRTSLGTGWIFSHCRF